MCYSAMVKEKWHRFLRQSGIHIGIREFYELFLKRDFEGATAVKIPRGFELEFSEPEGPDEEAIRALVLKHRAKVLPEIEAELFTQRARKADAERKLAVKHTKTAEKEVGVAGRNADRLQ